MKEILFRCSSLGDLMTNGRAKNSGMGETSKTLIKNMFLENEYGYKEIVHTPEILKGYLCEYQSRDLIQEALGGEFRARNTEKKHNDFIVGTCDHTLNKEDVIEDVKNSFTLKTFMNVDVSADPIKTYKNYYYQGQGYMWLWGKSRYRLIFTLNPTPLEIIEDEVNRLIYKYKDVNDDYRRHLDQIMHNNNIIEKLPVENRVKVINFNCDDEVIDGIKARVQEARVYYNTLSL